jgi:Cys-tRNA(Pro)/Cys-tRNA(Cys) deacylase
MGKEVKTNAMRILDKHKIKYDTITYECDEFVDGIHTAEITGVPVEQSYKTLVMQGKSGQFYVFVVPVASEVDLKAAARAVSEKSVEMIHVRDITAITGYVRGGCSPLGMKKQFPTVIDASAKAYTQIYVSGGRIGATIHLGTEDLVAVTRASFAAVTTV